MIKLFRNIRQSLLNEGKTTKYFKYAIGEIVLVVIGILIALNINNWNEHRKSVAKEKSVLAAIHNEFLQNRTQLDSAISSHRRDYNYTKKLITMFPIDIKSHNLDSITKYAFFSLSQWTFNPSQGSINSIINTSSFDIIENDSLRNLLISWPDLVSDFKEDEERAAMTIDNTMDPYLSKHFDFNGDFKDKRNHLEALQSLEFEYIYKLRYASLERVIGKNSDLLKIDKSLNDIIRLSKPD
jgi:hypothetical protein